MKYPVLGPRGAVGGGEATDEIIERTGWVHLGCLGRPSYKLVDMSAVYVNGRRLEPR